MKYIELKDCEDRFLYRIQSNNLSYGVFNKENNGFIGIRQKFGNSSLDTEFHYDTGSPFGTVRPIEKLWKIHSEIKCDERSKELFNWLYERSRE